MLGNLAGEQPQAPQKDLTQNIGLGRSATHQPGKVNENSTEFF